MAMDAVGQMAFIVLWTKPLTRTMAPTKKNGSHLVREAAPCLSRLQTFVRCLPHLFGPVRLLYLKSR